MKVSTQEHLRERVYDLLGRTNKKQTLHHFLNEGVSRRTIYNIFSRYERGTQVKNKKKCGRPRKLNTIKMKKLKELAENRIGASVRRLARKFKVSKSCISKNISRLNLKNYKRSNIPQYTEKQLSIIPKRCRLLRTKFLKSNPVIIMDDEKYFTLANSLNVCNNSFYSGNKRDTPDDVKYHKKKEIRA